MKQNTSTLYILSWIFGVAVFATGILNMMFVHLVLGIAYILVSFLYFPPASAILWNRLNLSLQLIVKIAVAIFIVMFTLGVSELGDMID